jgi:hypothetical protein
MPRWSTYQVPVDTGLFTPVGPQPTAIFRLAFTAAGEWLSRYAISHRRLVTEHHTGFVIWAAQFVAGEPTSFLDGDCLEVKMSGRVRGRGTQFECEGELLSVSGAAAALRACCVPLRLGDDAALTGVPARLSPEVMAAFLPDEIDVLPYRSPVPVIRASLATQGTLLARRETPFTIHRHQCEVADQWFWPEAASLASAGREDLVRAGADDIPTLRAALGSPVQQLDLVFHRPFFLFDDAAVHTSAYDWQGCLVFIHDLVGTREDDPRATVIEQFNCADSPSPLWGGSGRGSE